MRKARVLLADDHDMLVQAFEKMLQPDFEVVGTVGDGHALLDAARELKPDVIVLDIGMPKLNGMIAAERLKKMMPETKLIFLTVNEDASFASEAMRIGASGYLLKSSAASELFRAIEVALKGRTYVTPLIMEGMVTSLAASHKPNEASDKLTTRQREVLQLLAEGRSMKEAAKILDVSPRTIAFHKYRIMEELGLKTTADLVQFAIKNDIISL
ncbi:MAG: response regulator transcription factor [Deltaproteobacteria bacterium]|nr:response regulator transcription factor [Deltaproteobacteria bacterium]